VSTNAERPSQNPTFRLIGSRKIWGGHDLALQSFETAALKQKENLAGLAAHSSESCSKAEVFASAQQVCWPCWSMDSSEAPAAGDCRDRVDNLWGEKPQPQQSSNVTCSHRLGASRFQQLIAPEL
jgi:hypothetical protein